MIDSAANCWKTSNGTSWTQIASHDSWNTDPFTCSYNGFDIVFFNGYFYAFSTIHTEYINYRLHLSVYRSSNCINWTLILDNEIEDISLLEIVQNSFVCSAIVFNSKMYVFFRGQFGQAFSSTNGTSWTNQGLSDGSYGLSPEDDSSRHNVTIYDGKLTFLGGHDERDSLFHNKISYRTGEDTDNIILTRVNPIASYPILSYSRSCVHNNHIYLVGGYSNGELWRSCTEEEADLGVLNVKYNNAWVKGTVWANQSGTWVKAKKVHAKNGGVWLPSS